MFRYPITYIDFFGESVNETLYFNLTKAELMEWEMSINGGLSTKIREITKNENNPEIAKIFKELILKSYGTRSDDGKHFIKNDAQSEEFSHTEAYSELFMKLISDADEASKFVKEILPDIPEDELEKAKAELK